MPLALKTLTFIDINELIAEVGIDPGQFETPAFRDYQNAVVDQTFTHRENGSYYEFHFGRAALKAQTPEARAYFEACDNATKSKQDKHGYLTVYYWW